MASATSMIHQISLTNIFPEMPSDQDSELCFYCRESYSDIRKEMGTNSQSVLVIHQIGARETDGTLQKITKVAHQACCQELYQSAFTDGQGQTSKPNRCEFCQMSISPQDISIINSRFAPKGTAKSDIMKRAECLELLIKGYSELNRLIDNHFTATKEFVQVFRIFVYKMSEEERRALGLEEVYQFLLEKDKRYQEAENHQTDEQEDLLAVAEADASIVKSFTHVLSNWRLEYAGLRIDDLGSPIASVQNVIMASTENDIRLLLEQYNIDSKQNPRSAINRIFTVRRTVAEKLQQYKACLERLNKYAEMPTREVLKKAVFPFFGNADAPDELFSRLRTSLYGPLGFKEPI